MNLKEFNRFKELLEGKEGCNFTEKIKGDPNSMTWNCSHNHKLSKQILNKHFPKEDINSFLKLCKNNSGYCDCEIVFNVNEEVFMVEEGK